MDFFFSIFAALIFLFFFIIFSTVHNCLLQKKRKENYFKNLPPTPPSSFRILGHLHLLKKPLHRSLTSLSAHYGPVLYLRFGRRPVLVVSSSALADECLSKSDVIFANRPRLLAGKHLGFNYSGIGAASYGPHWRNLRRLATVELLCTHRVQELSAIRAAVVRSLLRSLFHDWEAGKSVAELRARFSEMAFNAMMGMIADKRCYGENDVGGDLEGKRFRRLVKETSALSAVTNLGDFLPVLRWIDFGGVVKRMRRLVRERDELLQGLINEKLRDKKNNHEVSCAGDEGEGMNKKKKTLIEVLLSLQEKEPDYYSDSIIKGMIAVSN